jgi:hypothetical protein
MNAIVIAIAPAPRGQDTWDVDDLLRDVAERAQAIELSWEYVSALSAGQWLALRDVAARNEIPLCVA